MTGQVVGRCDGESNDSLLRDVLEGRMPSDVERD